MINRDNDDDMMTKNEVVQEISECLLHAGGEFIERIANQVLDRKVKLVGLSTFEYVKE